MVALAPTGARSCSSSAAFSCLALDAAMVSAGVLSSARSLQRERACYLALGVVVQGEFVQMPHTPWQVYTVVPSSCIKRMLGAPTAWA